MNQQEAGIKLIITKACLLALTLFLGICMTLTATAQHQVSKFGEDSVLCIREYSLARTFLKADYYEDALPHWRWAFLNCPAISLNLYIDGVKIMHYLIDRSENPEQKEGYIDTLMMVFDRRVQFFKNDPKSREGMVRGRQAIELINNRPHDTIQIFQLLDQSVRLESGNSEAIVAGSYFLQLEKVIRGNYLAADSIYPAYDRLRAIVDINLNRAQSAGNIKSFEEWKSINTLVESIFSSFADCEALIQLYKPKFERSPADTLLLKEISRALDRKDCTDDDLFISVTENLHRANPSWQSAYLMARMFLKKGDLSKADQYLEEAVHSPDQMLKARAFYYQAIIRFNQKNYPSSRALILKSLELNPSEGRCYILLGDIYAITAPLCGNDEITRRAGYWVAVDKYLKAKQLDASLSQEADRNITNYSRQFPSTEKLFYHEIEKGSRYQVNCWYSETTTVRSSD